MQPDDYTSVGSEEQTRWVTVTLDDVSRIAAGLPGAEERAMSQGQRTWFVRSKYFAWESWPWPSEHPRVRELLKTEQLLGVKLPGDDELRALVEGWPDVFIPSAVSWGGPKVTIRLTAIDEQHLREIVAEAWYTQAPKYLRKEFDVELG